MDNETAKRLRERLVHAAERKGSGQESEDYAQDVLLEWVRKGHGGKRVTQTCDQGVVDAYRRDGGDRRTVGFESKRNVRRPEGSLDQMARGDIPRIHQVHNFDFGRFTDGAESRDRAILKLIYEWGFKNREVADLFGVTESRICQVRSEVEGRISQYLANEEREQTARVQTKRFIEAQSEKENRSSMATGPDRKGEAMAQKEITVRSHLERQALGGLAEEEPGTMEGAHEARYEEWLT